MQRDITRHRDTCPGVGISRHVGPMRHGVARHHRPIFDRWIRTNVVRSESAHIRRSASFTRLVGLWSAVLFFSSLVACRGKGESTTDAAPPPSLARETPKESERLKDDLWRRATEGDALDLARLADREGAGGLLEGLEEGGAVGLAALAALPYAADAEMAYQRLGEIVRQLDPKETVPVLAAIHQMAARPRRQQEPLDPPGLRSCADALMVVATQKSLAKNLRVPAISALRLLVDRGAVSMAAIPTDLDAR